MSALFRKEARLLLPSWLAALAVATLPRWAGRDFVGIVPVVYGVAVLALALSPFGQECSRGTFGLLLAQPVDRRRFWRIKTGFLALALVSVWVVSGLCLPDQGLSMPPDAWSGWLPITGLMTLLAFSGGLWSSLLLRDLVPAFLCACIVPGLIILATVLTVGHWISPGSNIFFLFLWTILAVYGVAGIFWARRLFLEAEDAPWAGGQISLSGARALPLRWLGFGCKSRQNRWTALVKKEMQLQEAVMVVVPLLALLYLTVLAADHFFPQWTTEKDLVFGVIPGIWIAAVPALIGCAAVAEERRFRTLEGQLCLPITKRAQFIVKLAVALALGIVLGGVIPWILLIMGGTTDFEWQKAVGLAAMITGMGFYASTVSATLLGALTIAVCIPTLAAIVMVPVAAYVHEPDSNLVNLMFGSGAIFPTLAWPVLTITVVWLAYKNYQRLQVGWGVWLGDLTKVGAIAGCVMLASVGIYDWGWELFQTLEPRHEAARLSGTGHAAIVSATDHLYVLLPDGRLWAGKKRWGDVELSKLNIVSRAFVPGSNWVNIAAAKGCVAGIRSDGTLWQGVTGPDIRQLSSDTDWRKITGSAGVFLAVKQNGTLWGWGHDENDIFRDELNPPIDVSDPARVGSDADWADVFLSGSLEATGVKRDGSTWIWGHVWLGSARNMRQRRCPIDQKLRGNLQGINWVSMAGTGPLAVAVRGDGTLWASGRAEVAGDYSDQAWYDIPMQVGTGSNWVMVSGQRQMAGLEADGKLWAMNFDKRLCPSKYADWLAATEDASLTWGLAKDGTLSCWNEFGAINPHPFFGIYLGPSRRPVYSGNILDGR